MAVSGLKFKTLPAITVATAGDAQPISSSSLNAYSVVITSLTANTGTQYLGDETVTSSTGQTFGPGDCMELDAPDVRGVDQFDLSKIYVDSSVSGAVFRIAAWVRE